MHTVVKLRLNNNMYVRKNNKKQELLEKIQTKLLNLIFKLFRNTIEA